MREHTWGWENRSLGPSNFAKCVSLDLLPIIVKKDGNPTNVPSKKNPRDVLPLWVDHGMRPLLNLLSSRIALWPKATLALYGKYVFGVKEHFLTYFKQHIGKIITMSVDALVVAPHPPFMYNNLYWSNVETKCSESDAFLMVVKIIITGIIEIEIH